MQNHPHEKLITQLGYLGLIPFIALALLMWLVDEDLHPFISIALSSYAATVASFLAGVHWAVGFLSQQDSARHHIWWSIALSLLAWFGVVLPAYAGLPFLAMLLMVAYLVDRKTYPDAGLKHWLTLRFRLTVISCIACLLASGAT
jgi:heme/copper-type cytochrome/quinol oxidase subunit 2